MGGSQRRRGTDAPNKQRSRGVHEIWKRCSARVRRAVSFRCGHAALWSDIFKRSPDIALYHFGLPTVFAEWANLAQDRAGWHKLVTTPPFAIGKPFVRQPRGDTRVTPEDKRRAVAQRATEIAERRAVFDANNNK